jgi:hypothetical protein
MLAPVEVRANANCPKRADGSSTFALWDQARAALLAAVVAREANPPRSIRIIYKRLRSLDDRVVEQLVQIDSAAVTARPFLAVLSSEDFARGGFARDSSGMRQYLAPYADVLLDDAFMSAHCFRSRDGGTAHPNQVGVVFETARRQRGRIDVDGVVWVDTAARVLVQVEFRYTGVPDAAERARSGGEIWFRQMANGLLIIDRWHIRSSGANERPGHDEFGVIPRAEGPINAIEYGGQVVEASWPDGLSWRAPLGRLVVHGVDAAGRAVKAFQLRLRGTNYAAVPTSAERRRSRVSCQVRIASSPPTRCSDLLDSLLRTRPASWRRATLLSSCASRCPPRSRTSAHSAEYQLRIATMRCSWYAYERRPASR